MTTATVDSVVTRIDDTLPQSIERLQDLLRIPSISTDPAYKQDTRKAAEWVSNELATMGFDSSVRDTPGHPMVVAHHEGPGGDAPHVLYYGHYDVQPPDPLELWDSPPFEPAIVDGPHGKRIVARGAVDDKGQLMTFVEAFRAWIDETGSLPIKVTVMLEGEEESGSPSLNPFLEANRDELQADVCIVCDTGMWDINSPAITYTLRGLLYLQVTLRGPTRDLHSGAYGGAVVNPVNLLSRIIGELHNDKGQVQIPGFYDDVVFLTQEERGNLEALGFDARAFLEEVGMKHERGEEGWSTLERLWARPTCDVNGFWGGYIGEGAKTVIASEAHAKISCRLVANQQPDKILAGLKEFFAQRVPDDCEIRIDWSEGSPAIRVPTDSPYLESALAGLEQTYDAKARLIGSGGSIPVVGSIRSILGYDSLLVGFGLDDDRMHSPNEKFELRCYEMGIKSHANIIAQLAGV